ncbi:hypothetical protein LTR95_007113 [Oleoguttula sp. CCFEE 5521]
MASGSRGQISNANASSQGTQIAMRDGGAEVDITSGAPVAKAAYIKHFETLQAQSKAQMKQLRQQLVAVPHKGKTKVKQSAVLLMEQKSEFSTFKQRAKAERRKHREDHRIAKDQYKKEIKQLKQQLETVQGQSASQVERNAQHHETSTLQSGAEIEQLERELETLRSEHTRWQMQGARLSARIQDMSEAELHGLYAAGAKLVGSQTAELITVKAEVELLIRNREFAATDAALRQVIQRLESEIEGLKVKLKLADEQATGRGEVMAGHVEVVEDYKRHLGGVKMSD